MEGKGEGEGGGVGEKGAEGSEEELHRDEQQVALEGDLRAGMRQGWGLSNAR